MLRKRKGQSAPHRALVLPPTVHQEGEEKMTDRAIAVPGVKSEQVPGRQPTGLRSTLAMRSGHYELVQKLEDDVFSGSYIFDGGMHPQTLCIVFYIVQEYRNRFST